MNEVCFLIGRGGVLLWADDSGSAFALPDRRARWQAIWRLRRRLQLIAHSHPRGPLAFSAEDLSTMWALDAALGRSLDYVVVAPQGAIIAGADRLPRRVLRPPWWIDLLRRASGMEREGEHEEEIQ